MPAQAKLAEDRIRRLSTQLANETRRRHALQDRLDQAVKLEALGEMTSGIAHDLNNLIAGTAAAFQLIAKRSTDERVLEVAGLGARTALRGEAMVKRLLAFARRQATEPADFTMPAFFADSGSTIRQAAGDVKLTIACAADTWPVRADPMQLEAALINLVCNARDALGPDGRIDLQAANVPAGARNRPPELAGADAVAISVSDTGQVMPPDVLQRVAEPFFTTKAAGKGTGLGLAMVHGFARQCGGAVRMESRLGEGTKVVIFVPRAEPQAATAPGPETGALAGHQESTVTVLLVNGDAGDQPATGNITAQTLHALGYTVQETTDALAAMLAAIRNDPLIDIVVSKVPMPADAAGAALVDAIRHERPHLPILFVTGPGTAPMQGEEVLAAPFTNTDIAVRIDSLLQRAVERRQENDLLDRLASRIRSPRLKRLLQHWRDVLPAGHLPGPADFGGMPDGVTCDLAFFSVNLACVPMRFTPTSVGSELARVAALAGSEIRLSVTGDETPGAREAAYRRCVKSARPCYEHARFSFGNDDVTVFERLILPFAEDGATVCSILSAVTMDATQPAVSPESSSR